ncbi:MAG TPA: glycosyltransferase family 39 protein [Polyangia bacterium]
MDAPGLTTDLWIVLLGTVLFELWALRRLRFDWVIVALVLLGTVLHVDYLSYTSISERNYDGPSHIEYIRTIAQDHRLPDVFACGPCGHPPLYYALAALWSKVVTGGWIPYERGLQWLSLLLFFGFVVFALSIFRRCTSQPATLRLATALVVFWPSSVINAVRVHNDALASVLMLGALYFIAKWDGDGKRRDFHLALLFCALALLTKSSGYALATTLVLLAALRAIPPGLRGESLKRCAVAVVVLGSVALGAIAVRASHRPTTFCQKVLGSACDGRYVPAVVDRPSRFVRFDLRRFVLRMDTLPDDPGHDYFLNRLAKSSLFGVTPVGDELAGGRRQTLAVAMSVLLLAMVASCLIALPFLRGGVLRPYRVYIGGTLIMFAFLVAFRVRAPNEFHEDFRHIFPALVPFCIGYAKIVERLGRSSGKPPWLLQGLRGIGIAMGVSMVLASAAFFASVPAPHHGGPLWKP